MTTILDPARPEIQAVFLRAHLRLRNEGMPGRITLTDLLSRAAKITGKSYKRSQIPTAISDLTTIIEASQQ